MKQDLEQNMTGQHTPGEELSMPFSVTRRRALGRRWRRRRAGRLGQNNPSSGQGSETATSSSPGSTPQPRVTWW